MTIKLRHILPLAVMFALLIFAKAQPTLAQDAPACPAEVGCPDITLSPNTLLGDFFLNEQLLAAGQNHVVLQVPPSQQNQIVIRNIQSPGEVGFNELFVYQETTVNVNVQAGSVRTYTAAPRKQFIRGTLNVTCDPRNRKDGEDVSCQIIIDGADRGVFPAGQAAPFILDPGARVVRIQLVGGSATLWDPNVKEQSANVTAGRTSNLNTRFDKQGHLIVTLNQANVVGDFFVNDVQIGAQVPSVELFVAAGVRQNIAVRNLNPPPSADYRWDDATSNITLSASQERTVTLRLQQVSLISPEQRAAQRAALNLLDRADQDGLDAWYDLGVLWLFNTVFTCEPAPAVPAIPEIDSAVLAINPAYQDIFNQVSSGLTDLKYSADVWNAQCGRAGQVIHLEDIGLVVNNLSNAYDNLVMAEYQIDQLR